jgi:hypothetical protein
MEGEYSMRLLLRLAKTPPFKLLLIKYEIGLPPGVIYKKMGFATGGKYLPRDYVDEGKLLLFIKEVRSRKPWSAARAPFRS